ncbi:MAG: hypothetical protein ACHQWH_01195 [Nitrososphaerales archaeon]
MAAWLKGRYQRLVGQTSRTLCLQLVTIQQPEVDPKRISITGHGEGTI